MQKSRRWVEDGFVSRAECHELIDVHRTCGVVGYRDRFSVTTLREPLARPTPDWPLLMPLARLRDRLRDAVEERTGEQLGLFVEWTGLSCWHPRSSIPPHYDSNRPYLRQRHYSVVLYLNDTGRDFDGGTFQFFDDKGNVEEEVAAVAGRLLIFDSGPENVHGVTPITKGERFTFTVWLTRDVECWEDPKILLHLPGTLPPSVVLVPEPPASFRPSTTKRSASTAVDASTPSSEETPGQAVEFDLEAEVLRQLGMDVWARYTTGSKLLRPAKRPRGSENDGEKNEDDDQVPLETRVPQQDDTQGQGGDEDDSDEDQVVVRWRGRVVPLCFESVRRAIELVAFVAKTTPPGDADGEARRAESDISSSSSSDAEDQRGERWWRQRVDEWLGHRRHLAEQLRVALPKWKDAGCLYECAANEPHQGSGIIH